MPAHDFIIAGAYLIARSPVIDLNQEKAEVLFFGIDYVDDVISVKELCHRF